jgi:hypothetical protein
MFEVVESRRFGVRIPAGAQKAQNVTAPEFFHTDKIPDVMKFELFTFVTLNFL